MAQSDTLRALRWSRWGLLAAAIAIAAALCLSSWLGYSSAKESALSVTRGQSVALHDAVASRLRGRPLPEVDDAELQGILDSLEGSGLRYLAVHRLPNWRLAHAGSSAEDRAQERLDIHPSQFGMHRSGERVRLVAATGPPPPPRPRPGALPGPMGEAPRRGGPPGRVHRGPPPFALVFEFEPGAANLLVDRARTSMLVSSSVALALLVAALLGFAWLKREERAVERRAREKQLASLGEMSAVLAHEIRNPLASLKGHAQLLAEYPEKNERKRAKVERIVSEATRLEGLTSDLLSFVRTGEIHRVPTDVRGLARQAAEAAGPEHIELRVDEAPKSWPLDGDRMEEALVNLLQNAIEASGSADAGDEPRVTLSVSGSKEELFFEVADRGEGIPEDVLPHIFEPFHTNKTRGTGLGLAVSRRIVELHGGTIEASNRPEGGALLRIELPRD